MKSAVSPRAGEAAGGTGRGGGGKATTAEALRTGRAAAGGQDSKSFDPKGLRVLLVDDDPVCLRTVQQMLDTCEYKVSTVTSGQEAVRALRQNAGAFDMVLSDVHMPDMDGFNLLEVAGLEMDVPVIMMSGDESFDTVLKGILHGACDFLVKPVRLLELRNIWQHLVRRWVAERDEENDAAGKGSEDKGVEKKKPRVVWTPDLHKRFVNAVNEIGLERAVPKRILDLMGVQNLTRENVASHLQKYRLYLKRLGDQNVAGGRGGASRVPGAGNPASVWGTTPPPQRGMAAPSVNPGQQNLAVALAQARGQAGLGAASRVQQLQDLDLQGYRQAGLMPNHEAGLTANLTGYAGAGGNLGQLPGLAGLSGGVLQGGGGGYGGVNLGLANAAGGGQGGGGAPGGNGLLGYQLGGGNGVGDYQLHGDQMHDIYKVLQHQ